MAILFGLGRVYVAEVLATCPYLPDPLPLHLNFEIPARAKCRLCYAKYFVKYIIDPWKCCVVALQILTIKNGAVIQALH
jgi:hypothetical protein